MDLQTFSDCLLHLLSLYGTNQGQPRELEFAVYRFIFWVALSQQRPEESVHVTSAALALIPYADIASVRHALSIQSAVCVGDYCRYFRYGNSNISAFMIYKMFFVSGF
jgi:hypothetical protein